MVMAEISYLKKFNSHNQKQFTGDKKLGYVPDQKTIHAITLTDP